MSKYHRTLGVATDASIEEVTSAYHREAHKHHPDRGGDPEKFKKIQDAYENIMKGKESLVPLGKNAGPVIKTTVYTKTDTNVFTITEEKLDLMLRRFEKHIEFTSSWKTSLIEFSTLVIAALTSNGFWVFRREHVQTFFGVLASVYLVKLIMNLVNFKTSPQDFMSRETVLISIKEEK